MTLAHTLIALGVLIVWSFNFVVVKLGLQELSPQLLIALRFALVALLTVPFVPVPRGRLKAIAALSVTLGLLHFSCMFTGLAHVDAAVAAVTVQVGVPIATVLAAILFRERFGWRLGAGILAAMAGIAILAGEPRAGSAPWAIGLIVAAAFFWAIANLQLKDLSAVGGLAINGWMALFATPQLILASLILEDGQWQALAEAGWRGWGAAAYQAVMVVILGYSIWHWLLGRYGVNRTVPFTLLLPVLGVFFSVSMLGEPVTWHLVLGGATTVAGVALIVLRRPPPKLEGPAGSGG
jgi:O-acetylserine/cysteine efflux transporter